MATIPPSMIADHPDARAAAQQAVDDAVVGDPRRALERAGAAARGAATGRAPARRDGPETRRGCDRGGAGRVTVACSGMLALLPELAGGPEASRLRTGVGRDLARRGHDRAAVHELGLGRVAAHADGQVGRADAAAGALGEEALDAPVLERVEGERGEAAADLQRRPRRAGAPRRAAASSPLTAIRIAWKVRLAGWPPANRAGAGMAAVIASLSSKVVVSSARPRRRTISPAIRSAKRSSPYSRSARAIRRRSQVLTISRAPSAPGRGPCACRAARRRRRRTRARGCRPASSSCRGPCRRGPRARPSSISCCRPLTKSARMKRVSHGDLGGELGERGLGGRVAVDRDQRPGRADAARRRAARDRRRRACSRRRSGPGAGPAPRSAHRRGPGRASGACQEVWPRDSVRSGARAVRSVS